MRIQLSGSLARTQREGKENAGPPYLIRSAAVVSTGPKGSAALLQAGLQKAPGGLEQHPCDVAGGAGPQCELGAQLPSLPQFLNEEPKGSATVSVV